MDGQQIDTENFTNILVFRRKKKATQRKSSLSINISFLPNTFSQKIKKNTNLYSNGAKVFSSISKYQFYILLPRCINILGKLQRRHKISCKLTIIVGKTISKVSPEIYQDFAFIINLKETMCHKSLNKIRDMMTLIENILNTHINTIKILLFIYSHNLTFLHCPKQKQTKKE